MTATRPLQTCWLFLALAVAAAPPAGAAEPDRPGPPNPLPAMDAVPAPATPQPVPVPAGQESAVSGSYSSASSAPRFRPLRNFWDNRLKPCLQYSHWGYAEYFEHPPLGSSLYANMNRQILNGVRDQMVLYRYDFEDQAQAGAERLNAHGQRRLRDLTRWLQSGLSPLVVESVPGAPELSEARRRQVVERLAAAGIPMPDDLVVVGRPAVRGLSGEEAGIIYQNRLRQTRQGGTSRAGTQGGAGMTGGTGISIGPSPIPENR